MYAFDDDAIWDAYNTLLLGPDVERLRKLLSRHALFQKTIDIPGDIVEAGIFKGTGLLLWLKLLHIHCHGSRKRVVGFDLFEGFAEAADEQERAHVEDLLKESGISGTTPKQIQDLVDGLPMGADRCDIIAGDIGETAAKYVEDHPGFRISLLHLDLDLGKPTAAALEALWPRVAPGGLVVFDEYSVPKWTASEAIDAFVQQHSLTLETLPWTRTPGAFLTKPR